MKEYQGFPISNFRSGFNESLEPWMLPRDAFPIVKNAHLYRGVIEKIGGCDFYTSMSYRETIVATGVINGVNKTFTGNLNHAPSSTNFYAQGAINAGGTLIESFRYDSDINANQIRIVSVGIGNGVVDLTFPYAFAFTFNTAPAVIPGGYNSVFLSYDYNVAGDTDIMGIKQYFSQNGGRDILIFDTKRVGRVITVDGISIPATVDTKNAITEIPHTVQAESYVTTPAFNGVALVFTGTFSGPIVPGSVSLTLFSSVDVVKSVITDNSFGALSGVGTVTATGFINYGTGAWTVTLSAAPVANDKLNVVSCQYGNVFTGDYTNFFSVVNYQYKAFITNGIDNIRYYDGTCLRYLNTNLSLQSSSLVYDISKCLHVTVQRERLLLLYPTVNAIGSGFIGVPNGVYWSRAGNPLDFTNNEQLLASTSQAIVAHGVINSDLIIKFANSEWIFRYTGDAFSPFRFDSTNLIWRCDAPFSTINYDSYLTAVGKQAITASDGVNIVRKDEIIPDFTLNQRTLLEGPVISIDQTSIKQCYGERFDDFKEGWLCFSAFAPSGKDILRSDNVLAFNYLDETYAVYTFRFNCLGFGSIISADVWGNNFDQWQLANYAWSSYEEDFGAAVSLGGDKFGDVYKIGPGNFQINKDGQQIPILFDVISKNFNPFIEDGELCRLGYVDFFISANQQTKLRIQFYRDDTMVVGPDGNPTGAYQETTLTLTPTDSMSPTTMQSKVWKRVYVGAVAREHTIRMYQDQSDFTSDTMNQPVRIHAIVPYMKPAGRLFN